MIKLRFSHAIAAILFVIGSRAAWAQDELFVTNPGNHSVTVYTRTANGDVAPLRTISGIATGLNFPTGLVVDTVNNELLVANFNNNSITVYSRTASGNAAPLRTLGPFSAGLDGPEGLAVDTVNNELVVANRFGHFVTVFARTAVGNAAPLRTIFGAATGLNFPKGLAVDTVNNELAVANPTFQGGSLTVYSRTANGDVAPLRTISGTATGLNFPTGLAVDTVNNELVVASNADIGNQSAITVYGRTANGNVAPLRTISGVSTGLSSPTGLAVDSVNNEVVVVDHLSNSVMAFAHAADGDVAPLQTLSGAATGLSSPEWVAIAHSAPVPTITSLTASPTLPQQAGTPIIWTATATGGVGPLQYEFFLYTVATGLWTVEQAYSTADTWTWTPTLDGQYTVQVWVRNNGSTASYDDWKGSADFNIGPPGNPPTITSLTASPTLPQQAGTPITWTAMATGGTAPLQYLFALYEANTGTWSIARPYGPSNTWTWTPTLGGQYTVQVWVRNNGSTASYDDWKGSGPFDVTSAGGPLIIASLTASPAPPQAAGTEFTWTAMATGGTAPLQYLFALYEANTGTWSIARPYGPSNTWTWTASQAGSYHVQVWVRNNGSVAPYDAWKGSGFFNVTP